MTFGVGFVNRMANIGLGFAKPFTEAGLGVYDLARSTWTDDEYEGFSDTIRGVIFKRTGNGLAGVFGPDQGLGAVIGALPGWSRDGANSTLDGFTWVNKEVFNQPLATVMTMASIIDSPDVGITDIFSGEKWSQAYKIADSRSLGQAMFFMVMTDNIFDEKEIERAKDSGYYRWVSGFIDAAVVVRFDPFAIYGRTVNAARAGGTGPLAQIYSRTAASIKEGPAAAFRGSTRADLRLSKEAAKLADNAHVVDAPFIPPGTTAKVADELATEAAKGKFAQLADDAWVWVYHGTDKNTAEAIGRTGRITGDTLRTELSVSSNPEIAAAFGERVVAIQVRKGAISVSDEMRLQGATDVFDGLASSRGAVVRSADDVKVAASFDSSALGLRGTAAERAEDLFHEKHLATGTAPSSDDVVKSIAEARVRESSGGLIAREGLEAGDELTGGIEVALRNKIKTGMFDGTAEDASRLGNLQMRQGHMASQKRAARLETINYVKSKGRPEDTNIFQMYINATEGQKRMLKQARRSVLNPRMQAEGGNVLGQINAWLGSSKRVDIDTAARALVQNSLERTGRTLGHHTEENIHEVSGMLRKTVLNNEKASGGVGTMADVLAEAYFTYSDDLAGMDRVWRALTGDRSALQELHEVFQMSLDVEKTLRGAKGPVTIADMLERFILSGTRRNTITDFSSDSGTLEFIIQNEDIFPQEIMAEIMQEAVATGNDDLVSTLIQLTDSIDDLMKMRSIQATEGFGRSALRGAPRDTRKLRRKIVKQESDIEKYMRRASMQGDEMQFVDPLRKNFIPKSLGENVQGPPEPFNQMRLDALIEETGSNDVMRSLFASRGTVVEDSTDVLGNTPHMRFEPRATTMEKVRWSGTTQKSRLGRAVHATTRMTPGRFIDLNSDKLSVQAARVMQSSSIPEAEQAVLRGALDAATSVPRRQMVWERIETRMFETMAEEVGLSVDDIQTVLANINVKKHVAYRRLSASNLRFDADRGHSILEFIDPTTGMAFQTPVLATQTSKHVAIPNYRSLRRSVERRKEIISRYHVDDLREAAEGGVPVQRLATVKKATIAYDSQFMTVGMRWSQDGLEGIMKHWVPTALLRPAWVAKVVLIDERIRQIAQFGGIISWMDQLKQTHNSIHNLYRALANESNPIMRLLGVDGKLSNSKALRNSSATGALFGMAVAGPAGAAVGGAAGFVGNARFLKRYKSAHNSLPWGMTRLIDGHSIQAIVGNGIDGRNMWAESLSVSSGNTLKTLMGHVDGLDVEMRAVRGSYVSYSHMNMGKWEGAMEDTFNQIMGQDPFVGRFLRRIADDIEEGVVDIDTENYRHMIADELADWLRHDPAGIRYSESVRFRTYSDQAKGNYADGVTGMIDRYFSVDGKLSNASPDLLRKLQDPTRGRVTAGEWLKQFSDQKTIPTIHGQEVLETLGREGSVGSKWGSFVEKAWKVLGEFPADTLSRQPMFDNFYQLEMRRLIRMFRRDINNTGITQAQLHGLERTAKEFSLSQTRHVLYELGENSEFGEAMRMIMPFFGAWQEALTRYTGLAYENPAFFGKALAAWNSDVFDEDDEGNEYLTFRLPTWAAGIANDSLFFKGAFDAQETISFSKNSINMLGNGLPGLGPIVQYPIGRAIQERPELESTLNVFFPYGPPKGLVDSFLPAYARRGLSISKKDDDHSFAVMMRQNLKTKIVMMETGDAPWIDRDDPVELRKFLEEVESETKSLMGIRLMAALLSPTSVSFRSPYNDLIEIYRDLQAESANADEIFLREYGQDYFALTQATSRTINGMPPTLHGVETQERFGPLVEAYPELGSLISGADGGGVFGQFMRGIHMSQFQEGDRELIPLEEMAHSPDVRLGWIKYSRLMDFIEYQRVDADLPNLRVAEAAAISDTRQNMVEGLLRENPAWAADFYESDRGKWDQRMKGLRAIADTPGMGTPDDLGMTRRDLEPLGEYLDFRDFVVQELEDRNSEGGSASLDSAENEDLAQLWEAYTVDLVEKNLAWADLFHRYLDNDPVRAPLAGFANIFGGSR